MIPWLEAFRDNPIFVKEMRIGFREKKVFYALSAWVLLIALLAAFSASSVLGSRASISELPEAGRILFEVLFWSQLGLLCLIAPSLTTSAVSGERERKSFDMLIATQLTPAELLFGKFGFAFSFIVLVLTTTLPFEAVVFVLGGVSLGSFFTAKLTLASAGALACLIGLTLSARETRSAYANGATYLVLLVLSGFVTPVIAVTRYVEDVPGIVYFGIATLVLYFGLFLFWKAVQHFEERARHLKIILGLTFVFYVVLVAISVWDPILWSSLGSSFWPAYAPAHYLLFGLMLNPMRPKRVRERSLFASSLFARPGFWVVLLTVGLFVPSLVYEEPDFALVAFYTVLAGLGTALWARGLSATRASRYPFALGFSWLALNLLPLLLALLGFDSLDVGSNPLFISPMAYAAETLDGYSPADAPALALVFYAVLGAFGALLEYRRGSASPRES